jgi:hypothetical protein
MGLEPLVHDFSGEDERPRFTGPFSDGETRTRTGDTTIFRRAIAKLEVLKRPANSRTRGGPCTHWEPRKLRPFGRGLGDGGRVVSQISTPTAAVLGRALAAEPTGTGDLERADIGGSSAAWLEMFPLAVYRRIKGCGKRSVKCSATPCRLSTACSTRNATCATISPGATASRSGPAAPSLNRNRSRRRRARPGVQETVDRFDACESVPPRPPAGSASR